MFTLLPIAVLGFFLGIRHATDPDHVIAVGTIVSRERRVQTAALIGVLWGIGHTVTILIAGGAIILFEVVIPARIGLTVELSVALMLILLGGTTVMGVLRPRGHPHVHGDYVHAHPHGHERTDHGHGEQETPVARLDRRFGRLGLYQAMRPLLVGVVHGLAGSAAVALLMVATIHDAALSLAYLLVFGLGTIAGMLLITMAIALPFAYTARRLLGVNRSLALGAGLLSVGFGLFLAYQIGFVDGLFTGQG
ncbi:MAG TPA: high-affinity nickel-transport family protein [Methylomirabilota bacterium]|nr:high-affinity nickel-transport family protein [Methylomirabilota bacterium]